MNKKIIQNIKSIILALAIVLGAGYVSAAWTVPPATPPNGNVPAPINVGGKDGTDSTKWYSQFKTGLITLDHLITGDLTVTNSDGTVSGITSGSTLVADGNNTGKVKWQAPACSSVVDTTSSLSLSGNSGNNAGIVTNIATLTAGDYQITGSGATANSGGGGWAGVVITSSATLTYAQEDAILTGLYGTTATGGNDPSYKSYYNDSDPGTIFIRKRGGYNDGAFSIPSTSITVTGTKYLYTLLGQTSMSGSLNVNKMKQSCGTTTATTGPAIIGPLTDPAGTTSQHQVSFNLNSSSDVLVIAYVAASADLGIGYVKLLTDNVVRYTSYYGEECGKGCSGGVASVVLSTKQTLSAGTHTLKVQTPGSRPSIYTDDTGGGGVQFYVYVLTPGSGFSGGGGSSGVSSIVAGSGVTVSPVSGTGSVTVSATGSTAVIPSGTWCGVYGESGSGSNHSLSVINSCGGYVPPSFTQSHCPTGYTKFTISSSGANTMANPYQGTYSCVKD